MITQWLETAICGLVVKMKVPWHHRGCIDSPEEMKGLRVSTGCLWLTPNYRPSFMCSEVTATDTLSTHELTPDWTIYKDGSSLGRTE